MRRSSAGRGRNLVPIPPVKACPIVATRQFRDGRKRRREKRAAAALGIRRGAASI
jgi:hypothetical protein